MKNILSTDPLSSTWSKQIFEFIKNEPLLAPRSNKEIDSHLLKGEIYANIDGETITSFLFVTPLTYEIYEIHSFFTAQSKRGKGEFWELLKEVELEFKGKSLLAVTFYPNVISALNSQGYNNIYFKNLPFKTKSVFLSKRISLHRLKSIYKHLKQAKPTYLIKHLDS